ncbi:hypothetical protein [uncultured Polaribacter sp.]|uniref:hypothetical protein n=1 Tax=uncultured Polaribacter sp. TaxID=174711 RepID=UPI00260F38EA|nr:hypothetical protein [uncultured Polaribacter sp.]
MSLLIGVSYTYLAKRFEKNKVFYFFIGFMVSWSTRFVYLLIYGFSTDFKIEEGFVGNRYLSVLLSIIIPYLFFIALRKRLVKKSLENNNLDEIGKE